MGIKKNRLEEKMSKKARELKRAQAYCDAINKDLDNVEFKTTARANEIRDIIIPRAIMFINNELTSCSLKMEVTSPLVGSWKYYQCIVELKEKKHGED